MRINFLLPAANPSGGVKVMAIYAERLRARGHTVTMVGRPIPRPAWRYRLRLAMAGRRWQPVRLDHFAPRGLEPKILERFRPIEARDLPDADVSIASWWETVFMLSALPPEKGAKVHFVQHHEIHDHIPVHLSRGAHLLPMRRIAIAGWLVDVLARDYGQTAVDLVANSVDPAQFHAPPRGKQPVPTVGLFYSIKEFKGLEVSLAAIEAARRRVPDLRVLAFGQDPIVPHRPLPRGARYTANPAQEAIREIYAGCDAYVFGSHSEGFGLPILEAMACRTPVVATRTGAAPDFIEEGVSGHVVDVGDAEALGARLADVVSLPDADWRAMSAAAHRRTTEYSWDDATDRFEAALERAVAERSGLDIGIVPEG